MSKLWHWLAGASVLVAACGGSRFVATDGASGGSSGSAAGSGAGNGPLGVGGSSGGEPTSASGGASAGAGGVADAGAAGASGAPGCDELGGVIFDEHCYVDITIESVNQPTAVTACSALDVGAGPGHLLVLDSRDEQDFVLTTFLEQHTNESDAWLGLTCSSIAHPDVMDCYCKGCDDALLLQKRAAWTWLDATTASFGWVGSNPDAGERCAAFAYNPTNSTWGWVDRPCLGTTHQLTGHPAHTYRVICELVH